MGIISSLLAGIIIGPLARLALPGKQNISAIMTVLLGALGALVGYYLASLLGVANTNGVDWIRLFISVAVAALAVVGYTAVTGKR